MSDYIKSKEKEPYINIDRCLLFSEYLNPNQWRVYCVLNTYFNSVYPKQKVLAEQTGLHRISIITITNELVEMGLIVKEQRTRPTENGKEANTSCLYTIMSYKEWAKINNRKIQNTVEYNEKAKIKYEAEGYVHLSVSNLYKTAQLLDSNELRVFLVLKSYQYKGAKNPSYNQLAEKVNISRESVRVSLNGLEEKGLIKRYWQPTEEKSSYQMPNSYMVYDLEKWLNKQNKVEE